MESKEAKIIELTEAVNLFAKRAETVIEDTKKELKRQVEEGEFSFLVAGSELMDPDLMDFSEELLAALKHSKINKSLLLKQIVAKKWFEMTYEEYESPQQYKKPLVNEFKVISLGGDKRVSAPREIKIDLSFNFKEEFPTLIEFKNFVKENIGPENYTVEFYLSQLEEDVYLPFNTDYHVSRCIISPKHTAEIIQLLKGDNKSNKILLLTEAEFKELSKENCGYCISCGKISDTFHEPDAENYTCSHCDEDQSFGIEECLVKDFIRLVAKTESKLEEAF